MYIKPNVDDGKVLKRFVKRLGCIPISDPDDRANPSTIQDKFLVGYQGWYVNSPAEAMTCGALGYIQRKDTII